MLYLYVKTHNKTGLKYLGKTSQDPYKYNGSGKYWKSHLRKHSNDVSTEIIFQTNDPEKLKERGLYFSDLWNITESSDWANLKQESGDGGAYRWDGMHSHLREISSKGGKARSKLNLPAWNKGKKDIYSEDTRRLIGKKSGESRKGVRRGPYNYNHSISSKSVTVYGVTYHSIAEAIRKTGHCRRTIMKLQQTPQRDSKHSLSWIG